VWAAIFKYLLRGQIWGDFLKGGRTYDMSILKKIKEWLKTWFK